MHSCYNQSLDSSSNVDEELDDEQWMRFISSSAEKTDVDKSKSIGINESTDQQMRLDWHLLINRVC